MSTAPRPAPRHRLLTALTATSVLFSAAALPATAGSFEAKGRDFLLDGKPIQILSGEIHYPRVPRPYWQDRLRKAKAMGLNTICTYLFWNLHEPQPGRWDFADNLDIVAFLKACQAEGLHAIVRPGPYVCAEWELGGYPAWLLADPQTKLRSTDPRFLKPAVAYLEKVSAMLKPLQVENGGPVLMVQVENEYGSFEDDKAFLQAHADAIRRGGFTGTLFTADSPDQKNLRAGTLGGVTATVNFGNNARNAFQSLERFRPGQVRMNGEFWVGWFDHWGKPRQSPTVAAKLPDLEYMLQEGISVNLYMFHGGTNWAFTAGANWTGRYDNDVTSYDYSAVLDEGGLPTAKFDAFREAIRKHVPGAVFGPMPEPLPVAAIPRIDLTEAAPLFLPAAAGTGPAAITRPQPSTMEALGQSFGFIRYQTSVQGPLTGVLKPAAVRDRAIVWLDGRRVGTMDRRVDRTSLPVTVPSGQHQLDILVENMARINFSTELRNERKGLVGPVKLGDKVLGPWVHHQYPLEDVSRIPFSAANLAGAAATDAPFFYRGRFDLPNVGDTWLDMRGFGKGVVWVNGRNLGRYWEIGPQQTLYLPGCWLKATGNEIVVLETDRQDCPRQLSSLEQPVWEVRVESASLCRRPGQDFKVAGLVPAKEGAFAAGTTWQESRFDRPQPARFFALESRDALDGKAYASVAELVFLDAAGREIPREAMKVVYADSEEIAQENGSATNVIDNQPTTFWHTQWKGAEPAHPHHLVLDLGGRHMVAGFRYLPRPGDSNVGGRIRNYRVYLAEELFPGL